MKDKRPIISEAIILNPSLENICKNVIFRYFDINTDKIFDKEERNTLRNEWGIDLSPMKGVHMLH